MSKRAILFILHVPPPIHGAAMMGQYIKNSTVINEEFETDFINLSTSDSLHTVEKMGLHKLIKLLQIQRKIVSHLIQKRYDLCYVTLTTSGPGFYKDMVIVALLKLFRKKILYHFHNKGISQHNSRFNQLLYKFAFRNTNAIVLSNYLIPDLLNYFKKENIAICANGIPELHENEEYQQDKNQSNRVCRIVFLSNMIQEKGVYVLVEACRMLKETYKDSFECIFAGGWTDIQATDFKTTIKNAGLSDRVQAVGPVYGSEKNKLLDSSDIFVFPTFYHNECFPLVLLEAMQHKLPVISTFEGGIPDIVTNGETGFLVTQKNSTELADKIHLFIQDPALRLKMGKTGYLKYKNQFTKPVFENNLIQILQKATQRKEVEPFSIRQPNDT